MQSNSSHPAFKITEIHKFDPRKGCKRCVPPGVGVEVSGETRGARPVADFWKNREGRLVGRFSCQGERFWFEATLASGAPILQDQMIAFEEYIAELLLGWLAEGIHEVDSISDWVRD